MQHDLYVADRVATLRRCPKFAKRYGVRLAPGTTHAQVIAAFGCTVFTCFVRVAFTRAYVKRAACEGGCGAPAAERCHAPNASRLQLIKRALDRVWPEPTVRPMRLDALLLAFLEEHAGTGFALKCAVCHLQEKRGGGGGGGGQATRRTRGLLQPPLSADGGGGGGQLLSSTHLTLAGSSGAQ